MPPTGFEPEALPRQGRRERDPVRLGPGRVALRPPPALLVSDCRGEDRHDRGVAALSCFAADHLQTSTDLVRQPADGELLGHVGMISD